MTRVFLSSMLMIACSAPPPPAAPLATERPAPAAEPATSATSPADAPVDAAAPPNASLPSDDPVATQASAKKVGKAAFVVFCARWVAACGELANALADSGVQKILNDRFAVAKVDATDEDDPATKDRLKRYNVKGLPLMIVFDRKGKEVAREIGYVDAQHLTKLLERAK